MSKGKSWALTRTRHKKCLQMLAEQHTIGSIAHHYKIDRTTLAKKLRESGIDAGSIRNSGKISLRAAAFDAINNIEDPVKRVDMTLRYLNQYPISEELDEDIATLSNEAVKDEILRELREGA